MSYSDLKTFHPPTVSSVDPAECCVGYKYKWLCGGNRNGPDSTECGQYMAKRCSEKWDSFCEIYSKDVGGVDFNNREVQQQTKIGTGDKFLREALRNKFCIVNETSKCRKQCTPFNGADSDTPEVCGYYGKCDQTCELKKEDLSDPLIAKCLENPEAHADVLKSLCSADVDMEGSSLGDYCRIEKKKEENIKLGAVGMSNPSNKSQEEESVNYCVIVFIIILVTVAIYFRKNIAESIRGKK